ncbi:MAG: HEAT repeat domain-containing protein [Thermoguttaceae bacterium]|jgi:HEAT repeat protein
MTVGLATTFSVLSKTDNESAVRILLPALDSSNATIKEGALATLLKRRNPSGQVEILRRTPTLSQRWKFIIQQHAGRLTGTMRDAMLGSDETQYRNACMAAAMFSNFDLIPTLLTVLEDPSKSKADRAAETMTQLASQLYDELAHPGESGARQDLQWIHQHVVSCLETSVQRFGRHRRREVIEAFLLLVKSDNAVINQILENSHHVSYLVLIDAMSRSSHDGIIRLLLDFLDNQQAPLSILNAAANRCDMKFIRNFLHKVDRNPSDAVLQNLKRMGNVAWMQKYKTIINDLDDAAQHSLVFLVMSLGMAQSQVFSVIEYILQRGKPGGRREAARALAAFNGAEANMVALRALGDDDPQVQANVLPHIRRRGIPGALQCLVKMLDSPHLVVRQAARNALGEFSFARFLGTFEMLDGEARKTTAAIVKKIDQHTIPLLREELRASIRFRRLRGLQIVQVMDVACLVEETLIEMLGDEDEMLRVEAAITLAGCRSPAVRSALEKAARDGSPAVREAAQKTLTSQLG